MSHRPHLHVIDPDFRRRAQIAYELTSRGVHTEIYESLAEFASRPPENGAVLIADDWAGCDPATLSQLLDAARLVLPFAAYSGEPAPQRIVAAMLDGALDYLRWPLDGALLDTALGRLSGEGNRLVRQQRREVAARTAVDGLSDREHEVLELMMSGLSNKGIGENLGISPRTVEIHRGNMMRKLNARTPSAAVRVAMIAGLDECAEDEPIAA